VGGIEAVTGVGLILGPWIGTPLYNSVGFSMCFLLSGGILCLLALLFILFLPKYAPFEEEKLEVED
jgi:predicted MFS family arabinose efflux permease